MLNPQKKLHDALATSFAAWGRIVAARPIRVLVVSLICFLALCVGLIRITPESRSYYLWVPTTSRGYQDWKYLESKFGVDGHSLLMYARAKSGNVFDRASVEQLLAAHKFTVELQAEVGGKTVRFSDACKRLPEYDDEAYAGEEDDCYTPNFLALWNYDADALEGTDAQVLQRITQLHQVSNIESFAGNVVFGEAADGSETVEGAEAVVLIYSLNSDEGPAYDIQPAWNEGIAGSVDSAVLEVTHFSNRSFDDEVNRLVSGDIPLFALGITIISIFVACTLGPLGSLHRSRVLLGVMATVNVLLSVGGGFGIACAIGVKFPSIASLLPLIVLGVQVDSVIILVDNVNAEPPSDPPEQRVANSLSRSGPAVLVTALTTISAFATSTTTSMPAIAMFASFGALSFTVALFVTFTFFLALLVLDERRLEARRVSFAPCLRAPAAKPDEEARAGGAPAQEAAAPAAPPRAERARSNQASELLHVTAVQRFVRDRYGPALLSPPVSALVVLGFAALAVLSAFAIPHITVGLPLEDVLPDGSYVADALAIQDSAFKGQMAAAAVLVRGADYSREETREAYAATRDAIADLDFVKLVPPDWLSTYGQWRALSGKAGGKGGHLSHLREFLDEVGFTVFQESVVCESSESCEAPTDTRFTAVFPGGAGDAIEQVALRERMEAELRREGFDDGFVFAEGFLTAESDVAIWHLTWTNMVYAIAAIFGVMALFNPLPIAVWITVCVALIDLDLLGVVWACGLKLNAVTYVNLVMAVGLSVDYCVHIAHAFYDAHHGVVDDSPPGTPISARDSTIYALTTMGSSVIKGGFTTILGVLVIAFASSTAFRTFFTMISFTVLLGLLHGMALLPILLTYATVLPPSCRKGVVRDAEPHAPAASELKPVAL